jgi:hypothetical protein
MSPKSAKPGNLPGLRGPRAETNLEKVADLPAREHRRWYRERIAIALEELSMGDQRAAVVTLLYALDGSEIERRFSCPDCGQRFEWPGLLEKHRLVDCPVLWESRRAA